MPCASNKASVHSNNHEQSHVLHSKFTPDGICTTHSASPLFIHAQLPQLAPTKDTLIVIQREQPKVIVKEVKPKKTVTEKRKEEFDW